MAKSRTVQSGRIFIGGRYEEGGYPGAGVSAGRGLGFCRRRSEAEESDPDLRQDRDQPFLTQMQDGLQAMKVKYNLVTAISETSDASLGGQHPGGSHGAL